MEKITNVTKGTDPARVQENKPAFFVSWLQDGTQRYQWFPLVSSMYTAFDRLKAAEQPPTMEKATLLSASFECVSTLGMPDRRAALSFFRADAHDLPGQKVTALAQSIFCNGFMFEQGSSAGTPEKYLAKPFEILHAEKCTTITGVTPNRYTNDLEVLLEQDTEFSRLFKKGREFFKNTPENAELE